MGKVEMPEDSTLLKEVPRKALCCKKYWGQHFATEVPFVLPNLSWLFKTLHIFKGTQRKPERSTWWVRSIIFKVYFYFISSCVCICMSVCQECVCISSEATGGYRIPENWSCRQLWDAWVPGNEPGFPGKTESTSNHGAILQHLTLHSDHKM